MGVVRLVFIPIVKDSNIELLKELQSAIIKDIKGWRNEGIIKSSDIVLSENKVRFILNKTKDYKKSMPWFDIYVWKFLRSIGSETNDFYNNNVDDYENGSIRTISSEGNPFRKFTDLPGNPENIVDFYLYPVENQNE